MSFFNLVQLYFVYMVLVFESEMETKPISFKKKFQNKVIKKKFFKFCFIIDIPNNLVNLLTPVSIAKQAKQPQ